MSGLCMGIQLRKAGIESFAIYEKADEIGGTWRDNTYPGCACDVPAHLYSYSFDPELQWSRMFAEQPEILRYFRTCASRYGLDEHIRLSTEIVSATFDEREARWRLRTSAGEEHTADVVVCAPGQLNRPRYPDVPGLDQFGGTLFHSARWDHGHDLSGESVAVIGNAASAIQLVPRIAPVVRKLSVFQRSANWIIPKPDRIYSRLERKLLQVPFIERLYRDSIYWRLEARFATLGQTNWLRKYAEHLALRHLQEQVPDPELRRALTPDYPIGCKRILISSDYYPALMLPHVELVTSPIERAVPEGLVTGDGRTHATDTIVLATGFDATHFIGPISVRGLEGRSLHEQWAEGAEAYLGVAVSGFPNFFVLYGPNTNLGHNSIIFMVESQVGYVMQCIRALGDRELAWLDVRREVMDRFNREVQERVQGTVWAAGCNSWYKNESGKVTNNWPDYTFRYARRMRAPDLSEFNCEPRRRP